MYVSRSKLRLVYGEEIDWLPNEAYIFEWFSDDETLMWGWCDSEDDLSRFIRENKTNASSFVFWRLREDQKEPKL